MKDKDGTLLWEAYSNKINEGGSSEDDASALGQDEERQPDGTVKNIKTGETVHVPKKISEDNEDVVEEEMYDCIRDYMSDGYSRAEATRMCSGRGHEEQTQSDTLAESPMPEDDIFSAIEMAESGDWQSAVETVMSALANDIINNEEGSPTSQGPSARDGWSIHTAIEQAIQNQLMGETGEKLSSHISRVLGH